MSVIDIWRTPSLSLRIQGRRSVPHRPDLPTIKFSSTSPTQPTTTPLSQPRSAHLTDPHQSVRTSLSNDRNQSAIMSVQLPPATHRKRALPQGELEAASTLKLGADQNTHTLSLSEARLVINKVLENKRRGGKKYEEPE